MRSKACDGNLQKTMVGRIGACEEESDSGSSVGLVTKLGLKHG